uniref:Uncharacterized protein n=1 Tax=Vertebrata thuyoides TaxID=2006970 RepID=A0A1Z1MBK8_9FLOR|nr:hypothetical protein [Vertebrata thuyoides]ARW63191.1 hypothetical protein [Vertebrata thuyoides]
MTLIKYYGGFICIQIRKICYIHFVVTCKFVTIFIIFINID